MTKKCLGCEKNFTIKIKIGDKMTEENKSILKLLTERDKYKKQTEFYEALLKHLLIRFYNIGVPLNDNVLKFNNEQLLSLTDIVNTIKYGIEEEE